MASEAGSEARSVVLGRIRAATGGGSSAAAAAEEWVGLPRDYRRASTRTHAELLDLLIDRLRDYDAQVIEVAADQVPAAVVRMMEARGLSRVLMPLGIRPELLPAGLDAVLDTGLTAAELDRVGGVITEATLAIAETGTIVLQNVPGQGRRAASLVPDYHLCLVDASRVVETVPEAMAILQSTASLPTTFISGPSATADIEMVRIKGVHGPRSLDVILFS